MSDRTPLPGPAENSLPSSEASNRPPHGLLTHLVQACAEAAAAPPEPALGIALRHLRAAAGADRAFLIEATPKAGRARVIAMSTATAGDHAFSGSMAARALRGERPLFWADVRSAPVWTEGGSVRALALRSALACPLPGQAGARAAIVLDSRSPMSLDACGAEALVRGFAGLLALLRRGQHATAARETAGTVTLTGRAPAFLKLLDEVAIAARVPFPALILGESGSGKELIARRLHADGPRASGPFVAVNCAALPEALLERELFGATRGAFTGADRDAPGLVRQADGGTLFLDEIGDMPPALQAKLLRVLQDGSVRAVGAVEERAVDLRVVAATHRDLAALAAEGRFRPDLRYRLEVLVLRVPPLRERPGDVPLLAPRIVERLAARCGLPAARIDSPAMERLAAHAWPGNVRELEAVLARALLRAQDGTIALDDLDVGPSAGDGRVGAGPKAPGLERAMIEAALSAARGNLTAAAARIGWSRQTLYRRLDALGLRERGARREIADGQDGSTGGGTRSSDNSTFQ